MSMLLKDLQYAVRSLIRRPLLFAVATLSLALGISANTTIFSAIDAYLIRPLLGASRRRLISQLLTESVVLAIAGGDLG